MKEKIIALKEHYEGVLKKYQKFIGFSEYEQGSIQGKISILEDFIEDLEIQIKEWEEQ